jgi:hypothetical protein
MAPKRRYGGGVKIDEVASNAQPAFEYQVVRMYQLAYRRDQIDQQQNP